jgi:hypothetical protein
MPIRIGKNARKKKNAAFKRHFLPMEKGAPGVTRTRDPLLRKQVLYPN